MKRVLSYLDNHPKRIKITTNDESEKYLFSIDDCEVIYRNLKYIVNIFVFSFELFY